MKSLEESWNEFLDKPFPEGYAGEEIEGICLATLDTVAAGCIDTFLDNSGRLDQQRISVLQDCARDLHVIVKYLDGKAKDYFEQLQSLAERILEAV